MLNERWSIEVEASFTERVDQFLSSMGYDVLNIGDSRASIFAYFHNSSIISTIKYGRSSVGMISKTSFIEFNSLEELIDAHFTGVKHEEV